MPRMVKVFEVCYDLPTDGRMGDGIEIFRTRNAKEAASFAIGRTCYGSPATVEMAHVPSHVVSRWGL